ncbi:MAG: GTP 3',8-cyclase MoaA [Alicyclobacillus sp.]|nr:GTP 3',8-cyclase MoaA [Alicyclobacillus sp.]
MDQHRLSEGQHQLSDRLGRPLTDLRISLTDRCNFRCRYCMPREVFGTNYPFLPAEHVLTFDEITRLTKLFVSLGVRKIRFTGGEPLLRPRLEVLLERLSGIHGVEDIALTTNGSLLTAERANLFWAAGLRRVTISLDALDDAVFQRMNDAHYPVAGVLRAVDAALAAGLTPVKVNMVVQRGVNDHCIIDMARHFRGTGCIVRFIEFMDVGNSNGWRMEQVVPAAEVVREIDRHWPLEPIPDEDTGRVATRYRYRDGQGEIGVIASVTAPFCRGCTRARLSADGRLYTCLFAADGLDLRALLRAGASDEELLCAIRGVWSAREDRYSEIRSAATRSKQKVEMFRIGG